MIKQTSVQQALKQAFPQFNDKSKLIDYYVSFDFPEKQMKMVGWWQKVLQFIIEHQNRAYVTYQQLNSYLSIYNLKPTPLQAIITYLSKKDLLVPQNEYEVKQANQQTSKQSKNSLLNTLWSYVYTAPPVKEESVFKFVGGEKIYSKKIKEYKKQIIKKFLSQLFSEHNKSISQFKLLQLLEAKVNLDKQSICQLLKELDHQNVIKLAENKKQIFVLYSHNSGDLLNKEWMELQRMKFSLRQAVSKFEFMAGQQEEKVFKLRQKAREQIQCNNRKSAKGTCKDIFEREKKIQNIMNRRNILENQITQLQYNEMNKTTMTLLEEAHSVFEQTMIDTNKLDQLVQKNMEIQISNKQTNEKMESLAGKEDFDLEVDEMLKNLEKQVAKQPEKQNVKVEVFMDIETNEKKYSIKPEHHQNKMQIQHYPSNPKMLNDFN